MASLKDFDKNYLFNLIMPTSILPEGNPTNLPAEPVAAPEPPPDDLQDSLSALRERLFSRQEGVPMRPIKNLVIQNAMETLVVERLDAAFDKFNCCKCDKCRKDVAAAALNSLPPKYVVSEPEDFPAVLAECSGKDVSAAIVKAIIEVKGHPRH